MNAGNITRGRLAKLTGCNIETVRYYEKIGLMPEPSRTRSGYRVYDRDDIKRLNFIMKLRALGFTLEETRGFLALVDGHEYTCEDVHAITLAHAEDIGKKIADLAKMKNILAEMADKCSQGKVPDCPIIDALVGE